MAEKEEVVHIMKKTTRKPGPKPADVKRGPGRPPREGGSTIQSALRLTEEVSDWVEELSFLIWKESKKKISRSEIVRGILQGVKDSGIDLTKISGEEELRELVLKKMRR